MYLTVVDRKLMQLHQQYWKSKEVYPWTFGRTQSQEINKTEHSILHKDLKKFPCKIQIKHNIKVADNKRESFL